MTLRLVHLTTADISLELLLGPQLSAYHDAGYEVFGVSAPGPFVEAVTARGVHHAALQNATRAMDPSMDAKAFVELTRLFRLLNPTIVHTHNPKPGIYGRFAARAARVPVIVNTVHGLYATEDDRPAKRAVVYGLERAAACASQAELVQNVEDIEVLRRTMRIPTSKLTLLGNGIDLKRFSPAHTEAHARIRSSLGLSDRDVVVGAIGRLVAEKGYPELFTAWRTISERHRNAVLLIIGPHDPSKPDALDPEVMRDAELLGVRFLGMRHDVEDLYHALDVYVLASHREGFPRSAMEAAATGIPIIATDIRGCRQVVEDGHNGLLVPVRDPQSLASALDRLVRDSTIRSKMGRAGTQKATLEFNQQRVIETTLNTYRRLLAARGITPP